MCTATDASHSLSIAGILLAAGGGSRFGMPKALAEVDGQPLSARALQTLREGGASPVIAVIGAAAAQVRTAIDWQETTLVENPQWETGMGSSLRAGLSAAALTDAAAALILLVDTPGITPAAVARLAAAAREGDIATALLAASYGGRQGHPVLIGRRHWDGVAALAEGDTGARPYLRAHRDILCLIGCDDIADGTDIDTPDARR